MTKKTSDLTLDIQIGGFVLIFWGFVGKKGNTILGLGMRPISCRVQVGARKVANLMS